MKKKKKEEEKKNKHKTDNKNWIPGYNQNNKLKKNSIFKSKVD